MLRSAGESSDWVEFENVVAGRFLRLGGAIVIERTDAGIGPQHLVGGDRRPEVIACRVAKILDFLFRYAHRIEVAAVIEVGRANQGVVAFERDDEEYPPVLVLQDVAAVVAEQTPDDDVTAFDEPDSGRGRNLERRLKNFVDPGAACVYQRARSNLANASALFVPHDQRPEAALSGSAQATRAGRDDRALVGRVARVQDHKAGVFGPAIRIFEPERVLWLERFARRVIGQTQGSRWGQQTAPAKMVVEKEA